MGEGAVNLVSSAMTNVTTLFTSAVDMVTGNDIPMAFIGLSLAAGAIALFRKAIHTR
jgi:hypothetical protein